MGEKISIFGAGYVGSVSAACLASLGHKIYLVDIDQTKIDTINSGHAHIIEPELDELIHRGVVQSKIEATQSVETAILNSDTSFICVGTPSSEKGSLNLEYIFGVVNQIAAVIHKKDSFHVFAIRSTVLPGTIDQCIDIIEKNTNKKHTVDFGFCANPEFLREGTAINDYFAPPYTLIGSGCDRATDTLKMIYQHITAPLLVTGTKEAELIKYVNNSFHALKVAFSNEIGTICKSMAIDSHEVMNLFVQDTKLNISPSYLRPGFAFGGSCLPKDLKALCYYAKSRDIDVPVLNSIMTSNQRHIHNALDLIYATGKKKIGVFGISFKAGTDDLRESPMIPIIETLLGKGYKIKIYDKNVSLSKIHGANKDYLTTHIPHIAELMVSHDQIAEMLDFAEVIVIGNKEVQVENNAMAFVEAAAGLDGQLDKFIIDLIRLTPDLTTNNYYKGICW